MKSEDEIRIFKESIQKNIDALWNNHAFHEAHEETIKLNAFKWVLEESIDV